MEQFFYGLIGICGSLLFLRVLISAARIHRNLHSRVHSKLADAASATGAGPVRPIESALLDGGKASPAVAWTRFREWSLTGKMILGFSAILVLFTLVTLATVFLALSSKLRHHAIGRAQTTVTNIGDGATSYVLRKDNAGLRAFVNRYANRPVIAYIVVESSGGAILAHSFAVLPDQFKTSVGRGATPATSPRASLLEEGAVHEVTTPVLEGRAGVVRMGIWKDVIKQEVSRGLMPLVELICLLFGVGIVLICYLARKLGRPINRLVKAAQSISSGDVETPSLDVEDSTEIGELSRALERLRSSVNAAMIRLK